ncbi:hypothetical protein [Streptomyces sp. NPDC005805]|uniref:hypothetical protein n=1 Tax=Streptomyces sp. NPDC005805 TaxID=3157068 RepID=UPI00340E1D5B
MVSVKGLDTARPQQWRDAADDVVRAAKQCDGLASYARDEVADTLKQCWAGDAGRAARAKFVKQADDYEAAAISLRALARTYDDLAKDIEDAQRDLRSGLDYAGRHGLKVDDSGRVDYAQPTVTAPGGEEHTELRHAHQVITDALGKALRADLEAARTLRAR